jgi:hypothetical protein
MTAPEGQEEIMTALEDQEEIMTAPEGQEEIMTAPEGQEEIIPIKDKLAIKVPKDSEENLELILEIGN